MYRKNNFDTFASYKKIIYVIFRQVTVMLGMNSKLSTQVLESQLPVGTCKFLNSGMPVRKEITSSFSLSLACVYWKKCRNVLGVSPLYSAHEECPGFTQKL